MFFITQLQAVTLGLFVRLLGLSAALGLAANIASAESFPAGPRAAKWTLGTLSAVTPGTKRVLTEGELVREYVLEATADGSDPDFIPQGILRLELTVFVPAKKLPGQKRGLWYVTGKWQLRDVQADPNATDRVRPGVLSGNVNTELRFNPLAAANKARAWETATHVPFSTFLAAGHTGRGQRVRGEGQLALGAGSANALKLQLKIWPAIQ